MLDAAGKKRGNSIALPQDGVPDKPPRFKAPPSMIREY
jgi:hypothetical protein